MNFIILYNNYLYHTNARTVIIVFLNAAGIQKNVSTVITERKDPIYF